MDFVKQINKGSIEVLKTQKVEVENYPYGFKKCKLIAEIKHNRNGVLIHRTTIFNGIENKPKKTTSCCKICFFYDKDLKQYGIIEHHSSFMSVMGLNFKSPYTTYNFHSCSNWFEFKGEHRIELEQQDKNYHLINDLFFKDIKRAKGSIISIDVPDKVIKINGISV